MSIKIPCKDMFESKPLFQELISGVKLTQAPQQRDGELVEGAKAAMENAAEKNKVVCTPPKGARKALTAAQRQALLGLRAMS